MLNATNNQIYHLYSGAYMQFSKAHLNSRLAQTAKPLGHEQGAGPNYKNIL